MATFCVVNARTRTRTPCCCCCCCFLDLFAIFWRSQPNRADRLDASILASYCWYRITFTYISGRCISAPEPARFPSSLLLCPAALTTRTPTSVSLVCIHVCEALLMQSARRTGIQKNNHSAAPLLQWSQTTANPSGPAIFEVAVDG